MASLDDPLTRVEVTMTSGTRAVVIGSVLIALTASGWFVLSWRVAHNPAGDAFDQSLGVAFGILILLSVVRSVLRRDSTDDADE
jgi:purine-cytosine permease-like protein